MERGMANELDELIDRYCAVWNEQSNTRRAELLAPVWEEGATYTDPSVHLGGADELLAHIETVRARRPGVQVLRTSAIDAHHGVARFTWHVVQADGAVLVDGIDFAVLSADGRRIARIVGFFGPLREMTDNNND